MGKLRVYVFINFKYEKLKVVLKEKDFPQTMLRFTANDLNSDIAYNANILVDGAVIVYTAGAVEVDSLPNLNGCCVGIVQ